VDGPENTIVRASLNTDHVFCIDDTDSVTIEGFNITGATDTDDKAGIYIYNSNYCNIMQNVLTGNHMGLYLDGSDYNNITNNDASSDVEAGFYLKSSEYNNIIGNTANYNDGYSWYSGYGIYLESNSVHNLIDNNTFEYNDYGCYLVTGGYGTVSNNTANHNNNHGLYVRYSGYVTIFNNTANDNSEDGIYLYESDFCELGSNSADNNNAGIYLSGSKYVEMTNNTMLGNLYNFGISSNSGDDYYYNTINETNTVNGKPIYYWINQVDKEVPSNAGTVYAVKCDNITVKDTSLSNNSYGIYLYETTNSTIEDNAISATEYGIRLYSSTNISIASNNADNSDYGVYLDHSMNNSLVNNNATNNGNSGIRLHYSTANILTGNNGNDNYYYGIILYESVNNNLVNNTVNNNENSGIYLTSSSTSNTLTGNNATNNEESGIHLYYDSNNNYLYDNIMSSNIYNIRITGSTLSDYYQNISTTNMADGKPIYYILNSSDKIVPTNAGPVYAINCTNITVKDNVISNSYHGILLYETSNSTIENVTIKECGDGIHIEDSENNYFLNNGISRSDFNGFYLSESGNNNLTGNIVTYIDCYGIYLGSDSDNSSLINNDVNYNSEYGIYVSSSNNISIVNNNANYNDEYGVRVSSSDNLVFTDNNVNNNNAYGIRLSNSYKSILTNNNANNNAFGFYIRDSENCTLTANNAENNTQSYEFTMVSVNNEVSINNDISINDMGPSGTPGFYVYECPNMTFANNQADENEYALWFIASQNSTVNPLILSDGLAEITFTSDGSTSMISRSEMNSNSFSGKTNINGYITIDSGETNIDMDLFYDDAGMSSSTEASIELYKLNDTEWDEVQNANLDTISNTVSVSLTESGTFALFRDGSSSSSGTSSSSSSSGSSSGSRASVSQGQSPEIVEQSVSSVKRVTAGSEVNYDFSGSDTPVIGVSFDAKNDAGLVVSKVQVLSDRPESVSASSGKSYQMMSIDVGSEGTVSSDNADNIQIRFKVSKQWIEENNIDVSTIRMTRYHGEQWNNLPTYQEREEGDYIYFYAETPGFSIFEVVGDENTAVSEQIAASESANGDIAEPAEGGKTANTPGFTAIAGIVFVSLVVLMRRK
ncbi:MAG: hypothetical protein PWQ51_1994, partial [Methanolobus sp.]|nr:hypothetical protein [Methanolobus sp.]